MQAVILTIETNCIETKIICISSVNIDIVYFYPVLKFKSTLFSKYPITYRSLL